MRRLWDNEIAQGRVPTGAELFPGRRSATHHWPRTAQTPRVGSGPAGPHQGHGTCRSLSKRERGRRSACGLRGRARYAGRITGRDAYRTELAALPLLTLLAAALVSSS